MFEQAVGVAAERNGGIFVPQDFGKRFNVHAALDCPCCEGVPQGVKAFVRDLQLFEQEFERPLIRAYGNLFRALATHDHFALASLFHGFKKR